VVNIDIYFSNYIIYLKMKQLKILMLLFLVNQVFT